MDQLMRTRMLSLSPLGAAGISPLKCKICAADAPPFDVVDFNKICSENNPYEFGYSGIAVWYYKCSECEFMFTNFCDDWSSADFASFIYNDDYIKVDGEYVDARPRRDARFFLDLLNAWEGMSILDYGSGAGVLASVLCEHGLDATCYDPFSHPERPERRFDVITCMEVIEHSPDPVGTLRDMASFLEEGGCILVGTGIQPADIDKIRSDWWYAGPRNGHVSLQSARSLVPLGHAAGLVAYRSGYLHGFATNPSPKSTALLARVGRPAIDLVLSAPDASAQAGPNLRSDDVCWHDIENERWRWTAQEEVRWFWSSPYPDCDLELKVPFLYEIAAQFAAGSRLYVNDTEVPLQARAGYLTGQYKVQDKADLAIRLSTPPVLIPHTLSGSDDFRSLGLAIRLYGAR